MKRTNFFCYEFLVNSLLSSCENPTFLLLPTCIRFFIYFSKRQHLGVMVVIIGFCYFLVKIGMKHLFILLVYSKEQTKILQR